jgi:hypothetical protein
LITKIDHFQFFEKGNEMTAGRTGFGGSSPVVQKAGAVRFLERSPRDMYLTGDYVAKPAMFGGNKHEGTMIYACIKLLNY